MSFFSHTQTTNSVVIYANTLKKVDIVEYLTQVSDRCLWRDR